MMAVEGLILLVTGLLAGFAGGLFGIGGGILIVPALYAVFTANGVPEELRIKLAIGTSLATIIVTSIRSVQGHHRNGMVEWALLVRWAPWIVLGAVGGVVLARFAEPSYLTLFFGVGLFALGVQKILAQGPSPDRVISPLMARLLGGVIGFVSSLMGIGGGVLGVLVLTQTGRTVHRAVGTAAGFGLLIAVPGMVGFMAIGWDQPTGPLSLGFVSLPAFAALAVGVGIAAPYGAKAAARLSPKLLTRLFAAYIIVTGVLMIREAIGSA